MNWDRGFRRLTIFIFLPIFLVGAFMTCKGYVYKRSLQKDFYENEQLQFKTRLAAERASGVVSPALQKQRLSLDTIDQEIQRRISVQSRQMQVGLFLLGASVTILIISFGLRWVFMGFRQ